MSIFDKFLKHKNSNKDNETDLSSKEVPSILNKDIDEEILFNENELVDLAIDGVIDTTSALTIKKFKHNLEVLVKRAKEKGTLDQFMIIRDDDFFPYDYEWRVASQFTCMERDYLGLSREARNIYALEKANLIRRFDGMLLPTTLADLDLALSHVDKEIGSILSPVHFRSTKHFTVNTPLGVTGNYNGVLSNRNFTILDTIDAFLNSGYGYSISYRDAYLDVTHESLPISHNAVVLINKDKYDAIVKNELIKEQLKQRRVVLYVENKDEKDGEWLAINMLLTELGVLPSQIGSKYFFYDQEIKEIIINSIKKLAKDYGLLFDKGHGGRNGHFTDYYDEKNKDYVKSIENFMNFLKVKFPDQSSYFTIKSVTDTHLSRNIVEKIGAQSLLEAIKEYNLLVQKEFEVRFNEYKKDRKTITPEVSQYFKLTVKRIVDFYNHLEAVHYSLENQKQIEEYVQHFYQASIVNEQIIAAQKLWELLANTLDVSEEVFLKDDTSSLKF